MSMRGIDSRTVNVKRADLLEKLRANKETFIEEYKEALSDFNAKVIRELQQNLKKAKKGQLKEVRINLVPPTDHTDDYQEVIDMMEVSVDEVINLDSESFKAYYKNEWNWTSHFKTLNSSYKL